MIKLYTILVLLTSLALLSCTKDSVLKECTDTNISNSCIDENRLMGNLDTLWTSSLKALREHTGLTRSIFHTSNNVFISTSSHPVGMIACFDATNKGDLRWFFVGSNRGFTSTFFSQHNNLVVSKTWETRLTLNMSTGVLNEMTASIEASGPRGIVLEDYIYYDEYEDFESIVHLRRSPIHDLSIVENIYTVDNSQIQNSKKSIESMNLWVNPETGDQILIFQHRFLGRVDVVAFNLNTRQIQWKQERLTRLGNSNHQQILVHNNKAYFGGGTTFYCFDMFTGDIVWEFDHPSGINSFMRFSPCIAERENAVIVKDGRGDLWGFDLDQGFVKMRSDGSDGSTVDAGSPIYHEGIVYFNEQGRLFAVDAADGRILWQESSSPIPFGPATFNGELAIDAEKGILYACSHDKLFAIKVIEK